ncbi:MAG: serine dehydratase subunit alpha family protein [Clostridia bacterium]|nr:serine dehydratase subunit alpha family protein [Clostridia bacterium]MBQ2327172.1 serine dehydratase subunit alpha family protein [Clostridia bacterium]MBQ5813127.1 serine dehydratase subunit alpha family protein [Clostridia bacterium]
MDRNTQLMKMIRSVVVPATGCTEPVAIALNASKARAELKGELKSAKVKLDICLLKNAMGVAIPGFEGARGARECVAVGIAAGDFDAGMNVLGNITPEGAEEARRILPLIDVKLDGTRTGLYIETILESDEDCVRVITSGGHDNIVSVEHAKDFEHFVTPEGSAIDGIENFTLQDFKDFADTVDEEALAFFKEGLEMNMTISEAGQKLPMGQCFDRLAAKSLYGGSLILDVQMVASCASYARMSGFPLPVMTVTGSGNQGIALFLPIGVVGKTLNVPEEKILRGIAFAQAMNMFIKHDVGTLSCLCSCSISAGLAGACGIIYMLGGTLDQVLACMKTVIGSATGVICDGAKEGCANKVGLSVANTTLAALMALEGFSIEAGGIVGTDEPGQLTKNIGRVANVGMKDANATIVDIMMGR